MVEALPKIVTDNELEKILEAIPCVVKECYVPYLNLLISIGAYTGLRMSEALNLLASDIDWLESTVIIRKQKNKKDGEKQVIPDFLLQKMKEHIEMYMDDISYSGGYLFFSMSYAKNHIAPETVRKYMQKLRKIAGVGWVYKTSDDTKNQVMRKKSRELHTVSFHTLRHYMGTKVYDETEDIYAVKLLLRHSSFQSCLRYMNSALKKKRELTEKIYSLDKNNSDKEILLIKERLDKLDKIEKMFEIVLEQFQKK